MNKGVIETLYDRGSMMHVRMWEKTSEARAEEVGDVPYGGRVGMTRSCRAFGHVRRLDSCIRFSKETRWLLL